MKTERNNNKLFSVILVSLLAVQFANLILSLSGDLGVVQKREEILVQIERYFHKENLQAAEVLAGQLLSRDPCDSDAVLWLDRLQKKIVG